MNKVKAQMAIKRDVLSSANRTSIERDIHQKQGVLHLNYDFIHYDIFEISTQWSLKDTDSTDMEFA